MQNEIIGVIGGSGLGDALAEQIKKIEYQDIDTPFGKPSGPVAVGYLGSPSAPVTLTATAPGVRSRRPGLSTGCRRQVRSPTSKPPSTMLC